VTTSLHIVVQGRVQGVSFRVYTRKQAVKLNIQGFVRNLANGNVEILAAGTDEALQQLLAWCRKGPALARVDKVIVHEIPLDEVFNEFEIR